MSDKRTLLEFMSGPTTVTIRPMGKLLIAAAIVIVVLLVYSYMRALGDADAGLYGLWQVDGDFADKAGIDSLYLFISPPGGNASRSIGVSGATCDGYATLTTSNGTYAEPMKIGLTRRSIRADAAHMYTATFNPPVPGIPKEVHLEYDACTGRLVITAKKTMYARMFKANEASYYCTLGDSAGVGDGAGEAAGDGATQAPPKNAEPLIDEDDESYDLEHDDADTGVA